MIECFKTCKGFEDIDNSHSLTFSMITSEYFKKQGRNSIVAKKKKKGKKKKKKGGSPSKSMKNSIFDIAEDFDEQKNL